MTDYRSAIADIALGLQKTRVLIRHQWRNYITPSFCIWALFFLMLSFHRLNFYEDFYKDSYEPMQKHIIMAIEGIVFAGLSFYLTSYFESCTSKIRFLFLCVFMISLVYFCPLLKPFEFFLLLNRSQSPFADCHEACSLRFAPNALELGINGPPSWIFIVYDPDDSLAVCVKDINPNYEKPSPECIRAQKHTRVWYEADVSADVSGESYLATSRLTKNYYTMIIVY